jgi:hypothetical protein
MATGLDYLLSSDAKAPQTGLDVLLSDAPPLPAKATLSAAAPKPTPKPSTWDVFGNSVVKGLAGLGDMVGSTAVNVANLGIAGYGAAKGAMGSTDLPDLIPADALSGYKKMAEATGAIKPELEPQGGFQRVVDFGGQVMGGGGLNPRSILRSAGEGKILPLARDIVTPAIGGTAGGLAAEGTRNLDPDTWYGRAASAILPAAAQMGASTVTARPNTAGERAAQTTKSITPDQWAAAEALAKKAAALGSPVSAPEALQAVSGTNPGLSTLQRVTEQSTHGVNSLAPVYAKRPEANKALFGQVADGIHANEVDPGALSGLMQNAATGAIDSARGAGNAAAAPFYAKSSNDPNAKIPAADWYALVGGNPAIEWALKQTKKDPLLGVGSAQPGSLQWLDTAKKFLDSHANSQSQAGNNFPAAQASKAATAITGTVDPLVPDYAKARSIIASNMRDVVDPMKQGQIGKLADTSDFVAQSNALLPSKPFDVTPAVVDKTVKTLGAQDSTIVPHFTAQYLRGHFNEANQDLQNGPNQFGGAKFAAQVAGNDMQRQNLTQLLSSSGTNPRGLLDALDVWRAQGTRPAPGSMTAFNDGEHGLLSGQGGLASMVGKPLQLPGLLMDKLNYGMATKDLAKTILPDGMTVERFKELARANGAYSPMEQAKFAALLTAGVNRAGQAPPQSP